MRFRGWGGHRNFSQNPQVLEEENLIVVLPFKS